MVTQNIMFVASNCVHSAQSLKILSTLPESIKQGIQIYDVSVYGVPPAYSKIVDRVPTLVRGDGNVLRGKHVRSWLVNQIPSQIEYIDVSSSFAPFGSSGVMPSNRFLDLDMAGSSLAPEMTSELEEKINRKLDKAIAYNSNTGSG